MKASLNNATAIIDGYFHMKRTVDYFAKIQSMGIPMGKIDAVMNSDIIDTDWAAEKASFIAVVQTHAPAVMAWLKANEGDIMALLPFEVFSDRDTVSAPLTPAMIAEFEPILDAAILELD